MSDEKLREELLAIDTSYDYGSGLTKEFLLPNFYLDRLVTFITQRDQARDRDYVKKESAEYHRREMMKYKASLDSRDTLDLIMSDNPPVGVKSMYKYHKSMYEQLSAAKEKGQ